VHPLLKPTHRPLWRDDRTVQLGVDPERALVLTDIAPPTAHLLRELDHDRRSVDRSGTRPSTSPLVDLLARARCLDALPAGLSPRLRADRALLGLGYPEQGHADRVLAARAATRVQIVGGGRVGAGLAHLLAASGVGRVTVVDPEGVVADDACPGGLSESDVGLRRGAAATALAVRAMPPTLDAGPPDVAVLCPDGAAPPQPDVWRPLWAARTALLCASVRETTAVVGPFTRPGGAGCPGCVSLHRADRDPAWPLIERQLSDPGRRPAATASAVLAVAAAATAAGEVLGWVDGRAVGEGVRPASELATLELPFPGWQWRRRFWGPHPQCSCSGVAAPFARQGAE
jgi:bacteriocin biosynthesis cyclodehydratase domain-containing protein